MVQMSFLFLIVKNNNNSKSSWSEYLVYNQTCGKQEFQGNFFSPEFASVLEIFCCLWTGKLSTKKIAHWWAICEHSVWGMWRERFPVCPLFAPLVLNVCQPFHCSHCFSGIYYSALKTGSRLQIAIKGRPFVLGVWVFLFFLLLTEVV